MRYGRIPVAVAAGTGALAAVHAAPAVLGIGPLRTALAPAVPGIARLSGIGRPDHVALTLDDGPDAESTPHFLRLLADRGIRATFFLVGEQVLRYPEIAADIAAAGHELAVHGLRHRLLLRYPRIHADLRRATEVVADAYGRPPRWFRPPYGVLSSGATVAAGRLGMRCMLWSTWGKDWTAQATGDSVLRTVVGDLRGGGTILLHDTASPTAAPESWRATLDALPRVLDYCAAHGWQVGPLAEHF